MGCSKQNSFSCGGSILIYNVTLFAVCLKNWWINWNSWHSLECLLSWFINIGLHRVGVLATSHDAVNKYQKWFKLREKWFILTQVFSRKGTVVRSISVYGNGNFGHLLTQNLSDKRVVETDGNCEWQSPHTLTLTRHLYLYQVSHMYRMFQTSQNRVNNVKR